jgi:hypothetical protein
LPTADQKSRPDTPAAPEATPAVKVPKHVLLSALLAQDNAAEKPVPASPAEAALGKTGVDVQTGDLVRFTGWLHWISRAPNGTYQLYVTPSPRSNAHGLIATVPPPDQPAESPATERQLQAVRSFITQRLLRQQKPSLRRSVMRKPSFIELLGLWSSPERSLVEPAGGGKWAEEPTAGWGIHPLLDVQFVTPPASSSRSRSP